MCGICGIHNFQNPESVDREVLGAMATVITHRGPDDDGFHVEDRVGLGMRRLAIIDVAGSPQPIYNEDRSIAVVCNGEIYNYRSLREELEARGHAFTTGGDIEVIAHLYEEYGPRCVEKLRGMFAFALWDAARHRLMVARDRLGIKPCYYAVHNGILTFGSEIKALLQHPALRREINPVGLHHYLSLNYVPAPYSLLKDVYQLLPGEYLLCDEAGAQTTAYWDIDFVAKNSLGESEWTAKVSDKLRDAVEARLMSDVPFGAFLSGGIDSSAVVAIMAQAMNEPVKTFSIDFAEKSYSEGRYAQIIADRYGTEHHVQTAVPDAVALLRTLVWHADDPLADSSAMPVYLVSKFAREHVTMVQTGDGGDEVFAGYDTYNAYYARKAYRRIPRFVRQQVIKRVVEQLPVRLTKVSFDFKAKRFVEGAELDDAESHFWWRVIFSETAKNDLYSDAFKEQLDVPPTKTIYDDYFRASGTDDPLSRMLYVDTRFYLPSDMLVKVDRMSMANALEARVPFLDHELVELAATMPSAIKFKNREKKYILKKSLEGILPDEILNRRKAGFNVPVNAWLAGELNQFARETLAPDRVAMSGLFNPATVERLLDEHERRKVDHNLSLWGLMCFQLWYEMFVAADTVAPPPEVAERWALAVPR